MRLLRILSSSLTLTLAAACGGTDTVDSSTTSNSSSSSSSSTSGSGGDTSSSSSSSSQGGSGGASSSSSSSQGGGDGGSGGAVAWAAPACTTVKGSAAVTFTSDDGKTLAPTEDQLGQLVYTYGLAALEAPNELLAEHADQFLRSLDAGCTWSAIGPSKGAFFYTIVPARGSTAFAYADNRDDLVRIDAGVVTKLKGPGGSIHGLATHPTDGKVARIGAVDGQLWETRDTGATWAPVGTKAADTGGLTYRVAIDPKNLDHAIVGTASLGAFFTKDAGATWKPSKGFTDGDKGSNVFSVVVSPVDSNVVWAQGIDMAENLANAPSEGRHVYVSLDGGENFTKVVDQSAEVFLINQVLLAAHPTEAKTLYFVFGTYYDNYGTDLFKLDLTKPAGQQLSKTHNGYNEINAIAFSPADPKTLYLGLTADAHP